MQETKAFHDFCMSDEKLACPFFSSLAMKGETPPLLYLRKSKPAQLWHQGAEQPDLFSPSFAQVQEEDTQQKWKELKRIITIPDGSNNDTCRLRFLQRAL